MNHVNASIEGTCAGVLLLILFFGLSGKKRSHADSFLMLAFLSAISLLSDMVIWLCPSEASYRQTVAAATFFEYLAVYLMPCFYCSYVKNLLVENKAVMERLSKPILYGLFLAVAALIGNLFFGYYYAIDEACTYVGTDFFWLGELYPIVSIAAITLVMLSDRALILADKAVLLFYAVFNAVGVVLILLFPEGIAFDILSIFVTVIIVYIQQYSQLERRLVEQDAKLKQSTIDLMVSQIKPHFLYNTLNSLGSLCADKLPEVEDAMIRLSRYLREHLDLPQNSKLVSLRDEIDHVKDYFHLEKIRFGDRVKLELDISHWDASVPVLSVLTLVENAVTHGICAKEKGGTVTIRSAITGKEHIIYIIDDGVGFDVMQKPSQDRSHIGLSNTEFRLQALCGGKLTVQSTVGEGTVIEMRIPNSGGSL